MSEELKLNRIAETINAKELKFEKDWQILQSIISILKSMGFSTCDRFLNKREFIKEQWEDGIPFPLVDDGGNGIRVSVSKRKELIVWFTNSFEEPDNPLRQKVVSKMIEAGLGANVFKLGYKN